MDGYIKKSEAVDVIVKYPYEIAGKTATAIKMIEDLPSADVVPKIEYDAVVSAVDNSTKEFLKLHDDYQEAKREVEKLIIDRNAARSGMIAEHERLEIARADIRRLHGILLQFTDIVHKWGAKNNIDTSEISLVPILQEEADSIIKKANQELASEIFAEIDNILYKFSYPSLTAIGNINVMQAEGYHLRTRDYAELKKKYTEDTK